MDEVTIARFRIKVDRSGGNDACWPYLGALNPGGYGTFFMLGRTRLAHRAAFFLKHGRWPEPLCCHHCDNRPCCNPRHLFEGTIADNNADRDRKGRGNQASGDASGARTMPWRRPRGERVFCAKLTDEDVLQIVRLSDTVGTRELGRQFGVAHVQVIKILQGKNWRHVTGL